MGRRRPTLEEIARYPIITYDTAFAGGSAVMRPFAEKRIDVNVVMMATDADVIKAYVELGLGIAGLPTIAFDARRDRKLRALDASHLFEPRSRHRHRSVHVPAAIHVRLYSDRSATMESQGGQRCPAKQAIGTT